VARSEHGLLTLEAAVRYAIRNELFLAQKGSPCPLDGFKTRETMEGLTLYYKDEEHAAAVANRAVRDAVAAFLNSFSPEQMRDHARTCGTLLAIRFYHTQSILSIQPEELDVEMQDRAVKLLATIARSAETIDEASASSIPRPKSQPDGL